MRVTGMITLKKMLTCAFADARFGEELYSCRKILSDSLMYNLGQRGGVCKPHFSDAQVLSDVILWTQ